MAVVGVVVGTSGFSHLCPLLGISRAMKMPDIASLGGHPRDPDAVASVYASSYPDDGFQDVSGPNAIPGHPMGVKPSGNALLAEENLRHAIGTFRRLPDELILMLLEWLDGPSLLQIGRTCKAFYAFTRAEDLWKALFVAYVDLSARSPLSYLN